MGGGLWSLVDYFGVGGATIVEGRTICGATTGGWFVESCGLFWCGRGNDCGWRENALEERRKKGRRRFGRQKTKRKKVHFNRSVR